VPVPSVRCDVTLLTDAERVFAMGSFNGWHRTSHSLRNRARSWLLPQPHPATSGSGIL